MSGLYAKANARLGLAMAGGAGSEGQDGTNEHKKRNNILAAAAGVGVVALAYGATRGFHFSFGGSNTHETASHVANNHSTGVSNPNLPSHAPSSSASATNPNLFVHSSSVSTETNPALVAHSGSTGTNPSLVNTLPAPKHTECLVP